MSRTPKILFCTSVLRHPPNGGPTLRIENSIKALVRVAEVSLYCRLPLEKMGGRSAAQYYSSLCGRLTIAPDFVCDDGLLRLFKRIINKLARTVLGKNLVRLRDASGDENFADVLAAAEKFSPDVIWLGYGNISYPLLRYLKEHSSIPVVVDTDSVWSRFVLRGLPYITDDKERVKIQESGAAKTREEEWGTRLADVTTAVSEVDAEYYRKVADDPGKIHLFSNVIDVASYEWTPNASKGLRTPALFLAGSFWKSSPMEQAARWVIAEVLPRVLAIRSDVCLYIVGQGSDSVLADVRHDHVVVTGPLPSVLPHLCHAAVSLVPLRYESGTRFKILEAGACGIPVVSTTLGAEGLDVSDGKAILIADSAEDFAAAILKILDGPELGRQLGCALKEVVQRDYSITRLANEARNILSYLEGRRRP